MRLRKVLYCVVLIITAILLSTQTVQAATYRSALLLTESGSSFARDLATYKFSVIQLPHERADASSGIHILITTLLHQLEPNSSPLILSASPEGNNVSDNISKGKVAPVPEPLTLLLLGTGLMGIALYRRLKNK